MLKRCQELAKKIPGARVQDPRWPDVETDQYILDPLPGGAWDIWSCSGGDWPIETGLSEMQVVAYVRDDMTWLPLDEIAHFMGVGEVVTEPGTTKTWRIVYLDEDGAALELNHNH